MDVVDSPCGVPAAAQAYVFNASVVPYGALGYLTLWPDGASQPVVSTLNALDASISSNMAIVPSTNGKVDAYASGTHAVDSRHLQLLRAVGSKWVCRCNRATVRRSYSIGQPPLYVLCRDIDCLAPTIHDTLQLLFSSSLP